MNALTYTITLTSTIAATAAGTAYLTDQVFDTYQAGVTKIQEVKQINEKQFLLAASIQDGVVYDKIEDVPGVDKETLALYNKQAVEVAYDSETAQITIK